LEAVREAAEAILVNEFEDKRIIFTTKITTLMIYSCAARHHLRETGDFNGEGYAADQEYAETSYGIFVRRGGQIDLNHTFIQSELMLSPFIYKFTMVY
jgi:hypothetical protein